MPSTIRQVHQLIPVFTPGDAMGQAAVAWQRVLRHLGMTGNIYAEQVDRRFHSLVKPIGQWRDSPDDLALYHHGIASGLVSRLLHARGRRGVVFHNITPARYYQGTPLVDALVAGRAQLAALADAVDVSIGVSAYNAAELREAGHKNVHVVPLFVEPRRYAVEMADAGKLGRFSAGSRPLVLSVSRVVAHKRTEDLLALHAELRRISPDAQLLIIGGYDAGHSYFKDLQQRADVIGNVQFLGRVDHQTLVAAYRSADVYVSMSEHEGFGVPLLEAMAADVPVLAFGAAAVPETMGGRGIVFDSKNFAALAELVKWLQTDAEAREKIVKGQRERLSELSFSATKSAMESALEAFTLSNHAPKKHQRPRVAVVVQRFGETITGGAEAHAREVAARLSRHAHVDVLTSCAVDHLTWKNELPAGHEADGHLEVQRFPVERRREMPAFNALSRTVFGRSHEAVTEQHWISEQGPLMPELLETLSLEHHRWDAVIFFTYLYAPTVWGVPLLQKKALVVPTAHDEPALQLHAFADAFECPAVLLCNTVEERQLIKARFPKAARSRVVGVGIEPDTKPDVERFRRDHGLKGPYVMYLGRLEAGKGVNTLLKLHAALSKRFHDAPMLVLAGAGDVKVKGKNVRALGRVSDEDKWAGLAGAVCAVIPSKYESLSLIALEAMAVGTPILVNAESAVLQGHVNRSRAGASFTSAEDYAAGLQIIGAAREKMSKAARTYASQFSWDRVIDTYLEEIERIRRQ